MPKLIVWMQNSCLSLQKQIYRKSHLCSYRERNTYLPLHGNKLSCWARGHKAVCCQQTELLKRNLQVPGEPLTPEPPENFILKVLL